MKQVTHVGDVYQPVDGKQSNMFEECSQQSEEKKKNHFVWDPLPEIAVNEMILFAVFLSCWCSSNAS